MIKTNMHRYAQLPQRAVMQSASLSRHFILPVVILARWWFKTLEVVSAGCGFNTEHHSSQGGTMGEKRRKRRTDGKTHKSETNASIDRLLLKPFVKRQQNKTMFEYIWVHILKTHFKERCWWIALGFSMFCVRAHPPLVPAVRAGRLVKLGAGRLSFFLSVSGACRQLLGEAWGCCHSHILEGSVRTSFVLTGHKTEATRT